MSNRSRPCIVCSIHSIVHYVNMQSRRMTWPILAAKRGVLWGKKLLISNIIVLFYTFPNTAYEKKQRLPILPVHMHNSKTIIQLMQLQRHCTQSWNIYRQNAFGGITILQSFENVLKVDKSLREKCAVKNTDDFGVKIILQETKCIF